MSSEYEYDLVVIGSGPAGEKGAAQAAYWGKKVALVERSDHLGGAGINTGTVPSKTLRETALYFSGLLQRGLYGIDYSLREDLTIEDFMYRKGIVVVTERKLIERNLRRHGIELIRGNASIADPHSVKVALRSGGERTLTTNVILVATGSSPRRPEGIPFGLQSVYDSDEILSMDRIPGTMAIIGGGVIGSEYACIFSALGVNVTLIDSKDRLLPVVDAEIAERLQARLAGLGLEFHFHERVAGIRATDEYVELELESSDLIEAEVALFATGRVSNIEGLGLGQVGVEVGDRGLVLVNQKYQTTVPNIYAAGDVIGFPALAATSMEQARVAMVHAFDLHYKEEVSPVLPFSVYTIPEISMVGLTEDECRAKGVPFLVGRSYYDKNPRGLIIGDLSGMCKLIFSPEDKRLLGVHWIGEQAAELIHLGAQVMAADGTIDAFIEAVYNYPTLTDSYKYAAYDGLGAHQKWMAGRNNGGEADVGRGTADDGR
jgi:NAD(P) transhydrogenase